MMIRFLSFLGMVSLAAAQSIAQVPAAQEATAPQQVASQAAIQFEDASDKAGIDFTHSFGSRQLGSLLEGTGTGCVWFDYNNSGLEMTRCIRIRSRKNLRRLHTIIFTATTATGSLPMLRRRLG
jgi:hypothetical protein